ncbi:MAG: NAD kinase [Paludibacteraceae bacterium]|nr:NAD kinase [Paludibacteraceae bacterium]
MKVAIFGNTYKKENLSLLKTLFEVLEKKQASVCVEESFYNFFLEHIDFKPNVDILDATENFSANLAISIGGDGTFLKTAAHIGSKDIPIIGINTGRLGFLADIASSNIVKPLEKILNEEFIIEERSILQLNCNHCPGFNCHNLALNEVAVMKQDSSSMITIHTYINDQHLISYQADGLIVATPTGSTAYSMSVGGPLVAPQAKNIILTPIASHSLTVRPLIITDDCEIRLQVDSRTNSFLAAVDGRSQVFEQSAELIIKKADFSIKVVKQKDHNFYNTLRNKLMWGVDKREQ